MTDTYQTAPSTDAPRRPGGGLVRPRDHVLGGVAGAIARAVGAEIKVIRIALVILGFVTGGAVVPAYLAGWLLIPEEGEPAGTTPAARFAGLPTWVKIVAVISLVSVVGSIGSPGLGFGVLLLGVGFLLFREDERARTGKPAEERRWGPPSGGWGQTGRAGHEEAAVAGSAPPDATVSRSTSQASGDAPGRSEGEKLAEGEPELDDPLWDGFPWTLPPELRDEESATVPTVPKRPVLGRLTLGLSLIGLAVTGLLDRIGLVAPDFQDYVAVALVCCGLGLLVGARRGRSRGLLAVGVLLGLLLLVPEGRPGGFDGLSGGIGERTYSPVTAQEAAQGFELGVGEQTIDLTGLDVAGLGRPLVIEAQQGVGQMVVIVPADVTVELDARVSAGDLQYFGRESGNDSKVQGTFEGDEEGAGTLVLDLSMGLGQISVDREEAR